MDQPITMTEQTEPKKRSRIPLIFFAFFGVVLFANIILIYIALSSWTGLETKNHYLKGLDYNETLADIEAQDALGWVVVTALSPADGVGHFAVELEAKDNAGTPVEGATVSIRFERPTHHGVDVVAELIETAPGRYTGEVTLAKPGQWNLRRLIWQGEETHQTIERVFLAPEQFQ